MARRTKSLVLIATLLIVVLLLLIVMTTRGDALTDSVRRQAQAVAPSVDSAAATTVASTAVKQLVPEEVFDEMTQEVQLAEE